MDCQPRRHATLLVGIDGPGGAGKSSFTQALARKRSDVTVVEMDDFFLPSSARLSGDPRSKPIGADFDWQRLRAQVLLPLGQDQPGWYQRYDWDHDRLAEWHTVPIGGTVIVEGVYSTRNELAAWYDVTIWLECPPEIRLARGIARSARTSARFGNRTGWSPKTFISKASTPNFGLTWSLIVQDRWNTILLPSSCA